MVLCLLGSILLILPGAAAVFIVSPPSPVASSPVTFSVANPGFHDFTWDFGDGYTAAGNPVSHTYPVPGTYTVTLHYTDSTGIDTFDTTASQQVTVVPIVTTAPPGYISIRPVGDRCPGDKFTITATTSLPVDDEVLVTVYSATLGPPGKTQSGEFSGETGTVRVTLGDSGVNRISFDVDSSTFRPDSYLVTISSITSPEKATTLFTVKPCPTPTPVTPTPSTPSTTPWTYQSTVSPWTPTTIPQTIVTITTKPPLVWPDIYPWALLLVIPLLGYVMAKDFHHGRIVKAARRECPKLPADIRFDGGISREDEPPGCLGITMEFGGGAEDDSEEKGG